MAPIEDIDPPATASGQTVVILIGWMGGSKRALQRYILMHEQRAKDVLVLPVCVSVQTIFSKQLRINIWQELLNNDSAASQVLVEAGLLGPGGDFASLERPAPQIVVHLFSNGGALMFHALQDLHPRLCGSDVVRAMIWDSAPGDLTLALGFNAITAAMPNAKLAILASAGLAALAILRILCRQHLKITAVQAAAVACVYWYLKQYPGINSQYHTRIICDKLRPPTMFFYSKPDKLVSSNTVDTIIAGRRALGVEVYQHCWQDSAHVAHGKQHESEYRTLLGKFLAEVLAR